MAFLNKSLMRQRGRIALESERLLGKSARRVIAEATTFNTDETYDVFLSHCSADRELIFGILDRLQAERLKVYVDWIADAELDRTKVKPANADRLRARMKNCFSLLYIASEAATTSLWMPWELGYFDGLERGPIGILPVVDDAEDFGGLEYLGLYPVVEDRRSKDGRRLLYIRREGGWKHLQTLIKEDQASRALLTSMDL